MDSFELNKIAGAVLGTLLFVMVLGIGTDIIYARSTPDKPGYALPAAAEVTSTGAAAAAPQVPLPELLAKADPKKGETLAKVCTTCHSFDPGGQPKPTGPDLVGVVGRPKGSTIFTGYSDSMKAKGGNWTYDDLNTFLTNPRAFVSNTKMAFGGEKDPAKRADIIAYLRSLEKNPPPLPEVKPTAEAQPAPAPAAPAPAPAAPAAPAKP